MTLGFLDQIGFGSGLLQSEIPMLGLRIFSTTLVHEGCTQGSFAAENKINAGDLDLTHP